MTQAAASKRTERRRRKDARPSEIVAAALEVFAEHGYERAKLEEVARRAGVAKGTVFFYFPNKQELFRAVAQTVLAANLERLQSTVVAPDLPLRQFIPLLLAQAAMITRTPAVAMIRLLMAEARSFPDIAQVWHDEVVSKMLALLTTAIENAQAKGEIRPGDPQLFAFSILGPMLAGVVFREMFGQTQARLPDMADLARQHALVIVDGLSIR